MKDKKRSIGFSFAWNGLKQVTKLERNFQIHLVFAVIIIIFGFLFQLTRLEWAIIIFAIGFVLVTELINTVIEKVIDYIKPDIHPTAKLIKDYAAGAVLVTAITAVLIGMIIFVPKLYILF
ncbi:diacylglycerol kinase family protein [Virgibacillus kimchii]